MVNDTSSEAGTLAACKELEKKFISLARIALSKRPQDVHAFLHRVARRREVQPALTDALIELLRENPGNISITRKESPQITPLDNESRIHLLKVEDVPFIENEPVFPADVWQSLEQIVRERKQFDKLLRSGLEPTRTSIFTGPPGVGKTLAARWAAREIGCALVILDLAGVMSSYLGRTGTNVRQVLDYAKNRNCVLLLDELDALAKRRDDLGEVGELKRLVTVLLQELDDWPSTGLLIAATNHETLLDPAIWRRFEHRIVFPMPDRDSAMKFIGICLADKINNLDSWCRILAVTWEGESYSDIERNIKRARRQSVLDGSQLEESLLSQMNVRELVKQSRIDIAVELVKGKMTSQRKSQQLTGIARETIRSRLKSPYHAERAYKVS